MLTCVGAVQCIQTPLSPSKFLWMNTLFSRKIFSFSTWILQQKLHYTPCYSACGATGSLGVTHLTPAARSGFQEWILSLRHVRGEWNHAKTERSASGYNFISHFLFNVTNYSVHGQDWRFGLDKNTCSKFVVNCAADKYGRFIRYSFCTSTWHQRGVFLRTNAAQWIFFLLSVDLCFIRLSHTGKTLFYPIFSARCNSRGCSDFGLLLVEEADWFTLGGGRGGQGESEGVIKVTVDSVRWSSCVHVRTRLHKYVHGWASCPS